jgi:hypothetical protein
MTLRLVLILALCSVAAAQDLISAKAGYLNYRENWRSGDRRQLADGETFRSTRGRSELLLTPGSFLRLEQGAEIRMISTQLIAPAVELVDGIVGLEVNEIAKNGRLTLLWGPYRDDQAVVIEKRGLYRFHADARSLRIYVQDGKLQVPGMKDALGRGKWVELTAQGAPREVARFERKYRDSFDLWSANRASQLSFASRRSAFSLMDARFPGSVWAFNGFCGCYTFLPRSFMYSPWGYSFYSPRTIYVVMQPPSSSIGNRGGDPGWGGRGGLASGPAVSAPGSTSMAPNLPAPRTTSPSTAAGRPVVQ